MLGLEGNWRNAVYHPYFINRETEALSVELA